jgi:hypothetical protein
MFAGISFDFHLRMSGPSKSEQQEQQESRHVPHVASPELDNATE